MKKVIKIFRGLAELLGYLSIIVGVIFIVKMKLHYSKSPSTKASYSDVRHVLNWSGIGDANFVSVLNSYESAVQSLDGDHFDAYKIKVKAKEYEALSDSFGGASDWHRLPLDNDVLKDALRLS